MSLFAQFEQLIQQARRRGYGIRYEHLDGSGGGICEFGGKRWLFVDLSLSVEESWEALHDALRQDAEGGSRLIPGSNGEGREFPSVRKVG